MSWLLNFSLQSPISLLAISSLLIPVLIHIFNINKGKKVYIGNIALIAKAKQIRITQVKLRQWILFLLRLFLFTLLILLLHKLFYHTDKEYPEHTSVFVTSSWLQQATVREKEIFTKRHAEHQVFHLNPGFPRINDIIEYSSVNSNELKLEPLLVELKNTQLVSTDNKIYSTLKQDEFSITRSPYLRELFNHSKFEWFTSQSTQNTKNPISVLIFHSSNRSTSLNTLKIALDTINKLSKNIHYQIQELNEISNAEPLTLLDRSQPDWIFWLSDTSVPESILSLISQGSNLVRDMPKNLKLDGAPVLANNIIGIQSLDVVFNHQLPLVDETKQIPLWKNQYGSMALSYQPKDRGKLFQFHSRFNSKWNDMPNSIQFPIILAKLLSSTTRINSNREISSSQLLLTKSSRNKTIELFDFDNYSLRNLLLFLISIIWLLERALSERKGVHNE